MLKIYPKKWDISPKVARLAKPPHLLLKNKPGVRTPGYSKRAKKFRVSEITKPAFGGQVCPLILIIPLAKWI